MNTCFNLSSPAFTQVEQSLLEQIHSAGSFDAVRHVDVPTQSIEDALAKALLNLHLLGRAQVWNDVESPGKGGTLRAGQVVLGGLAVEPLPFDEAIDFFRKKTNLSPEAFYALTEAARIEAFTVAVGSEEVIVESIRDLVDTALADGLSLREFQSQANEVLANAGVAAATPWYWSTVYLTNLQTSYQVGRWQQINDPAVKAERPYLRYVSARLPTSRQSHVEKHGLVYPQDHPFWDEFYPPNGFNCYCTTMTVSNSLLSRRGWKVSEKMNFQYPHADEGFGYNAGKIEAM
jgi:hypothetical protein